MYSQACVFGCILITSFCYLQIAKSFTQSCLKGVVKEADDVRCCIGVVRVCVCTTVGTYPHLRESASVYLYIHMFIYILTKEK